MKRVLFSEQIARLVTTAKPKGKAGVPLPLSTSSSARRDGNRSTMQRLSGLRCDRDAGRTERERRAEPHVARLPQHVRQYQRPTENPPEAAEAFGNLVGTEYRYGRGVVPLRVSGKLTSEQARRYEAASPSHQGLADRRHHRGAVPWREAAPKRRGRARYLIVTKVRLATVCPTLIWAYQRPVSSAGPVERRNV
jgi:hypothetical protein